MCNQRNLTSDVRDLCSHRQKLIDTAMGRRKADLVLKNATYVNVFSSELLTADIAITDGSIAALGTYDGQQELDMTGKILCPGFIDGHIHLESSLVCPSEFAKAVVPHGTTTVITDPHEITNVMGTDGIRYMLSATRGLPLEVHFMVPSCVPATPLDESGAVLTWQDIAPFMENPRVRGLAEMMDFPGILHSDEAVVSKNAVAEAAGKITDGHAPGLTGPSVCAYAASGIYSDHECFTPEEAMEKLRAGQYIMIREGTAAQNLEALMPVIRSEHGWERCMFCTDDKHPSDLLEKGHIDYICRKAVRLGADPIRAVQAASLHAAQYFHLTGLGAIAPGYQADIAILDDLESFRVCSVIKAGRLVCDNGVMVPFQVPAVPEDLDRKAHDTFHLPPVREEDLHADKPLWVLGMVPGQIITENLGKAEGVDVSRDLLKMAVVERHHSTGHMALSLIKGYGMTSGAVATSIAHDSHNIICVGTNDRDMTLAINRIAENHGGIVVVNKGAVINELPLEIAGLISSAPLPQVNALLEQAKAAAHSLGVSSTIDPFMTLSFMSLPVIPTLRLTTQGVVDVNTQTYLD